MAVSLYFAGKSHASNGQNVSFQEPWCTSTFRGENKSGWEYQRLGSPRQLAALGLLSKTRRVWHLSRLANPVRSICLENGHPMQYLGRKKNPPRARALKGSNSAIPSPDLPKIHCDRPVHDSTAILEETPHPDLFAPWPGKLDEGAVFAQRCSRS